MAAPIDHQQRIDALNPLRSICVTAPAGSGKTELLSQRVLTLLARVKQPEEILAITFTRKAAAEMHQRIMSALEYASQFGEPEEVHKKLTWKLATDVLRHDAECGWQLLYNSSRLKIQTIDSLCASLTKQMPILANFGAQPAITDNASPYYKLAVAQLLEQLETDTPLADDLELLLKHVDNDWQKIEQLLMQLLQRRDQWIYHIYLHQHTEPRLLLETSLHVVIKEHLKKLQHVLMPFTAEFVPLLDYAGHNLVLAHSDARVAYLAGINALPTLDIESLSQWRAFADFFLTAKGEFRKTVTKKNGFPTETEDGDKVIAKAKKSAFFDSVTLLQDNPDILVLLHELQYLPAAHYSDDQWQLLKALTHILPRAVAELTVQFQQSGMVDHSHISMAALQALGDELNPTDVMLKLDYQLKHILIDEFQDTASTQYELLKRLVEGWQEFNSNNHENPNTLFIVGDGMQSIYGFRQANVGLFLEARKQGVNGLTLDDVPLQVNFRSSSTVVDWINHSFEQAFPPKENIARGAVKYGLSVPFNSSGDKSEVKSFGLLGDDCKQREADKVVDLVKDNLANRPGKSIAILVRTRNHLNEILPSLSAQNIQWQAIDIDSLSTNGTIIDLLSLTKALLNKADRVAWAALLRTPMMGLNNSDLLALLGGDQQSVNLLTSLKNDDVLSTLSRHGFSRVTHFNHVMCSAYQQSAKKPLRSWVKGVWLALGGPACVQSSSEYSNVEDYFSLLESQQLGNSLSITLFEEAVARLYAAPVVSDSPLQVMTIHKSKGLEFDTVILPGLSRRPRSDSKELLMWREYLGEEGRNHLLISPLSAASTDDSIYNHLRHESSQSKQLENTRLLYVAATRAINCLYLTFTQD
ncbi:MAG: ATP-dependent exoDNAse (exonuclease V) beta subunit, partial [Pseudohongiellaceae bacterium]